MKIGSKRYSYIVTLLVLVILCVFVEVSHSQECQFFVATSWKKTAFPESECPCFHSDGDHKNESCLGNKIT